MAEQMMGCCPWPLPFGCSVCCCAQKTVGGVALFFITLIFPIQFDRQWFTLGWALEGAALLWLFHRVPHSGLRLAGVGLLIATFVRLALIPPFWATIRAARRPILNCISIPMASRSSASSPGHDCWRRRATKCSI
jgi:hypothetical protein